MSGCHYPPLPVTDTSHLAYQWKSFQTGTLQIQLGGRVHWIRLLPDNASGLVGFHSDQVTTRFQEIMESCRDIHIECDSQAVFAFQQPDRKYFQRRDGRFTNSSQKKKRKCHSSKLLLLLRSLWNAPGHFCG